MSSCFSIHQRHLPFRIRFQEVCSSSLQRTLLRSQDPSRTLIILRQKEESNFARTKRFKTQENFIYGSGWDIDSQRVCRKPQIQQHIGQDRERSDVVPFQRSTTLSLVFVKNVKNLQRLCFYSWHIRVCIDNHRLSEQRHEDFFRFLAQTQLHVNQQWTQYQGSQDCSESGTERHRDCG